MLRLYSAPQKDDTWNVPTAEGTEGTIFQDITPLVAIERVLPDCFTRKALQGEYSDNSSGSGRE